MASGTPLDAAYFDGWYADMAASPAKDRLMQRHLGLPPELLSTSTLPWGGIAEVVAALQLGPDDLLLDLACGRGGYGTEIARRAGARLVGVDFSAEAVRQATVRAAGFGLPETRFQVGALEATGLPDGSVTAVLCVDAIQFARPVRAAYEEIRRVLTPGGRVALTCWEAREPADPRLPERIRQVDLARGLREAGFVDVHVAEKATWDEAERCLWREATEVDPRADAALRSLHDEAVRALAMLELRRRVLATATAPATA
jgi:SAM-dependent methyltransferase